MVLIFIRFKRVSISTINVESRGFGISPATIPAKKNQIIVLKTTQVIHKDFTFGIFFCYPYVQKIVTGIQ